MRVIAIFERLGTLHNSSSVLKSAGCTSQELRDRPAAIGHYRRVAEFYGSLDGDSAEAHVHARELGLALLEHGELAAASTELEWALPQLETPEDGLAQLARRHADFARGGAVAAQRPQRPQPARVLADAAREDAAVHRAKLKSDDDPLNPVCRQRADRFVARVEARLAKHP